MERDRKMKWPNEKFMPERGVAAATVVIDQHGGTAQEAS